MNTPLITLPARAGIGLRHPHYGAFLEGSPDTGWLEVHSENFFGGGAPLGVLEAVRARYPVSLHGVGLSLGSGDAPSRAASRTHLARLKALADRIQPAAISDHLCWCAVEGDFLNDLLPLPYTKAALQVVCARVAEAQDVLGRPLLVENVSSYLEFAGADWPEWEFVAEIARRTGCGLLLDVNNIYVSACNHGFDPRAYLAAIPAAAVGEIHLAGHEIVDGLRIDTHSRLVCADVWQLYEETLARLGPRPTLIEWDNDIPALEVLLGEARRAQHRLDALSPQEPAHVRAA